MAKGRHSSRSAQSRFRKAAGIVLGCAAALVLALAAASLDAAGQAKPAKPYALIFGTVYGPDDRPLYGVPVRIRRAGEKRARWELLSDHRGEFAQRVPPGPQDYVVWTDTVVAPARKGEKRITEVQVRVESDERLDIGLHLKQ